MKYHKEKYSVSCKVCGVTFEVIYARKDTAKYCSRDCQHTGQKSNIGPNLGKTFTEEHRRNISVASQRWHKEHVVWNKGIKVGRVEKISNENHYAWKGDKVSYITLHQWVQRNLGTPSRCEHCGTTTAKRFEWANKSHEYRRDLGDWIRLCKKCHNRYDSLQEKSWATRRAYGT